MPATIGEALDVADNDGSVSKFPPCSPLSTALMTRRQRRERNTVVNDSRPSRPVSQGGVDCLSRHRVVDDGVGYAAEDAAELDGDALSYTQLGTIRCRPNAPNDGGARFDQSG